MVRLLVLEDDPDSLEMLQLLLEAAGFEVAASPAKADALRALERRAFDLVLADLLLDSNDVAEAWRTIDEFVALARPAPIGLVTAWPSSANDAAAHGLAFVLRKPVARTALFDQLARTLQLPELTADQQRAVRGYFHALERSDIDALAQLCTDDIEYQLPGADPRFARTIAGRDAFLAFTVETFREFRDASFELGAMRPLPGGALVEYLGSWRDSTGTQQRLPGTVMFRFRDGLISHAGVRIDPDLIQ
jgi:CheY-like chemotaxis protein